VRDLAQMEVPFLDLRAQHLSLEVELTAAFQRVLRDAVFVGGPELDRFESEFAAYCDVTEAVAVSSGRMPCDWLTSLSVLKLVTK